MGRVGHILFVLCAVYIGLLGMMIIAISDMREQVRHLDFKTSELNQKVRVLEKDLGITNKVLFKVIQAIAEEEQRQPQLPSEPLKA